MGSFNTTCFASGQTIAPGDACFILPIIQAHTYRPVELALGDKSFTRYGSASQTCYPDAFWRPYGGFIEAKYDDCGSVELVDTPINRLRLVHLFMRLAHHGAVVPQGKNTYHDVPFNLPAFLAEQAPELDSVIKCFVSEGPRGACPVDSPTLFDDIEETWAYVSEAAHEYRLFATEDEGYPFQVQIAILHKAARDNLIAAVEGQKNFHGQALDQRSFFDRTVGQMAAKLLNDEQIVRDALKNANSAQQQDLGEKFHRNMSVHRWAAISGGLARIGEMNGGAYPSERFETAVPIHAFFTGKIDLDGLFEALKPTLDARYVMAALEALNIHITQIVYTSQDYSNHTGSLFADFVQATRAVVDQQRSSR